MAFVRWVYILKQLYDCEDILRHNFEGHQNAAPLIHISTLLLPSLS
jgi:hypothetical protein